MKTIRINRRIQHHNFWSKWMIPLLFLLPAFQVMDCFGAQSPSKLLQSLTASSLRNKITHINISKPGKGKDWLHAAVETGDPDKVQVILEEINRNKKSGVRYKSNFPNAVDRHRKTALGKAIEKGYQKIVKLLIDNPHIEVNNVGYNKNGPPTSLLVALNTKQSIIAQILISGCGKRLDITTPNPASGATPLHLALKNSFKDVTQSLLGALLATDSLIDYVYLQDKQGRSPLHESIESEAHLVARALIQQIDRSKTPLDNLCAKDKEGNTPLHLAVQHKDISLVKSLVTKMEGLSRPSSLSIDYLLMANISNETPLDWAAYNNLAEIFSYLLTEIRKLSNNNDEWISNLFVKYNHKYIDINMFEHIIMSIGQLLRSDEWMHIRQKVIFLENSEQITPAYAQGLKHIIDSAYSKIHRP